VSEVSEEEITWSYQILSVLKEGLDKVAANPQIMPYFYKEFIGNLPDIFEAFINIVQPEHREVVRDIVRSAVRAYRRIREMG